MFDAFFLGMIIPTGLIAVASIGYKFVKDMAEERKKDLRRARANKNMFTW